MAAFVADHTGEAFWDGMGTFLGNFRIFCLLIPLVVFVMPRILYLGWLHDTDVYSLGVNLEYMQDLKVCVRSDK